MKEIGKLIELLNEYKKTRVKEYWIEFNIWEEKGELHIIIDDGQYNYSGGTCDTDIAISYIISKQYGFIKWLVENDKIDYEKCGFKNEGLSGNWYDSGIAFVQNYDNDTYKVSEFYSPYLQLLMLLSISSSPINDLISYLK